MDKKIEFDLFSSYDYAGIEEHLEKRASEGWMIEKNYAGIWLYKRIEPRMIRFYVSYEEDGFIKKQEAVHRSHMTVGGEIEKPWHFVFGTSLMKLYFNDDINPLPVNIRPAKRFENIVKLQRKNIFAWVVVVLFLQLIGILSINDMSKDLIMFISDYAKISDFLFIVLLNVFFAIYLIKYFIWKKKALELADYGQFAEPENRKHFLIGSIIAIIFVLSLLVHMLIFGINSDMIGKMNIFIPLMIAWYIGDRIEQGMQKNKKFSPGEIKKKRIIAVVIIAVALSIFLRSSVSDFLKDDRQTLIAKMPYNLEYLVGKESGLPYPLEIRNSIFSRWMEYGEIDSSGTISHWLYYEQVELRLPFLYDYYKNYTIKKNEHYSKIEDDDWGANEVYYTKGLEHNLYLLFYDDKILKMNVNWDMTGDEKAKIGKKARE